MNNVRKQVEKLSFQVQDPITLYLNKKRAEDLFVSRLGRIREFMEKDVGSAEGSLGVRFGIPGAAQMDARGKAGGGREASITYSLDHPLAQALVLEAELARTGQIKSLQAAKITQYTTGTGYACFRRPSPDLAGFTFDQLHRPWCLRDDDELMQTLERERRLQEFNSKGKEYSLLLLQEVGGSVTAAAIVNDEWNDGDYMASHRFDHHRVNMFGMFEKRVSDVPLISAILIVVDPRDPQ